MGPLWVRIAFWIFLLWGAVYFSRTVLSIYFGINTGIAAGELPCLWKSVNHFFFYGSSWLIIISIPRLLWLYLLHAKCMVINAFHFPRSAGINPKKNNYMNFTKREKQVSWPKEALVSALSIEVRFFFPPPAPYPTQMLTWSIRAQWDSPRRTRSFSGARKKTHKNSWTVDL